MKVEKLIIKKEDIIKHSRDTLHLDAVNRFPSRVFEDKRKKKEKYPKKYLKEI